jgi:ubiquinone/menaquinone biosynthesis C-methylase UbiE
MTVPSETTPDKIMQLITGGWASAILGSAAKHGVFDALEGGGDDAKGVARKTEISERGAQALLDGLTGLGVVTLSNGRYRNTADSSAFLVKGKPAYLGGMAEVMAGNLTEWATLSTAVKTGNPTASHTADMADNDFWHILVPAIAPLSYPIAQMASERLGIAKAGPIKWLDVGGGSGVWSSVWLSANREANGVQLDWPVVNKIARGFVERVGAGNRFETIDGDFHTVDFGARQYDYAIYGHIAHQETPEDNVAIFRKFRKALKPGGTLVVNDFILSDERIGHPFAMMFAAQMVLVTKGGNAWRQSDYRAWLGEAGFTSIDIVPTPTPATVVFAK